MQQQQKRLVEQIEEKRAAAKAQKPACLPAGGPSVTAACKCLSVKQATVTSTTTKVTKVNTYTKTVKVSMILIQCSMVYADVEADCHYRDQCAS